MKDLDEKLEGMYRKTSTSTGGEIESHEDLLEHYGEPIEIGQRMHINYLPESYRRFIRRSPLIVIGTADKEGMPSTSPKGDAPGFVKILDRNTLLIPDRPGNNQVETLHNLLDNPRLSLIFFIPGVRETLRVKGKARMSTDPKLREQLAVKGRMPPSVIRIDVADAYLHCGKALIRSKLWDPESQAQKGEVPTLAEATLDLEHNKDLPGTLEEWEERAKQVYRDTLY